MPSTPDATSLVVDPLDDLDLEWGRRRTKRTYRPPTLALLHPQGTRVLVGLGH